jgi:hypothetical protein
MFEQDYILLIFNCQKYRYKAEKQKETWLVNLPQNIIYFHIIGNPELTNDFIFDYNENILYIKIEDDYNSLPKKVILAYQAILSSYKFKYIFKTDDDQNVSSINFFNVLINILEKKYDNFDNRYHYVGYIVNIVQTYKSQYNRLHPELPSELYLKPTKYCSGRFYFLSYHVIKYLIIRKNEIYKEYLEDYAIGYNIPEYYKQNILSLDTNKYFFDFTD